MKKLLLITCGLAIAAAAEALTIHVPADYPTIQGGINASVNGDTVLVSPGTYVENIYYNGQNITVASLFLTTGNTSYIAQTIIDGNHANSVVSFWYGELSSALLCGFTIQNGYGSWGMGGGVVVYSSNPTLDHLVVKNNSTSYGGWSSGYGGGIACNYSSPVIRDVTVTNNQAYLGGGIYCGYYSNPTLINVKVAYNTADESGGGMYFSQANPVFDSISRCNIYLNWALTGNDIYSSSLVDVIVDTFTVLNPTSVFAFPLANFSFDILHGKIEQVEADLYVSPLGDDGNNGLTPAQPLKTIRVASLKILADTLHPRTIHLLEGTYSPSATEEVFPVGLPDYVNLIGVSQTGVILDAEGTASVIKINDTFGNKVSCLTITGGNSWSGGGIYCTYSSPMIEHVTITGNSAGNGGGLYIGYGGSPILDSVIVTGNSAGSGGGGIYIGQSSNPSFSHMIINNNQAYNGGGFYCEYQSSPVLKSVTVSGNTANNCGGGFYFYYSNPLFDSVERCNIYLNFAETGNDLYSYYAYTNYAIVVDTFSVMYPTQFFAYPLNHFNFDILHGKIEQVEADLYVSPTGNDNNTGLTASDPLKTIHHAMIKVIADSLHPHTIHLLDGIYSASGSGEHFPVYMKSHVTLSGVTEAAVVLDAEGLKQVIKIENTVGSEITELTITGGSGGYQGGGGIYCSNSDALIQNLTITGNVAYRGGGIYFSNSPAYLENVRILNNSGSDGGGGIYINGGNPVLKNLKLTGNYSYTGGGIYMGSCNPELRDVTVTGNEAYQGGGFYFYNSSPVFSSDERCNIYLNNANYGDDLYSWYNSTNIEVVVDTFTVLYPRSFQAYPLNKFGFDILHGLIPQTNISLYASPQGNNGNSGLTPDDPLKTIQYALDLLGSDSINYYTVNLLFGTYSPSTNQETFPVYLPEYLTLQGESETGVILDAAGQSGVIMVAGEYVSLANLTIKGGYAGIGSGIYTSGFSTTIQHVTVNNCIAYNGAGIYCSGNSVIKYVTLSNNHADYSGGGIYVSGDSFPVLNDLNIVGNTAGSFGGGIYIESNSNPAIQNFFITGNHAGVGGGIYCGYNSHPSFSGSTIANNFAGNGGGIYFAENSSPLFDSTERCNIYLNEGTVGFDLYAHMASVEVIVDTFTVLNPHPYFAYPLNNFTLDILHGKIQLLDADLYVSPQGDNNNSGLTPDDPLKTIRFASAIIATGSTNPHTIYLAAGTYSPSTTGEFYPILIPDYCNITGVSATSVILDGEGNTVLGMLGNDHSVITNMTIMGGGQIIIPFNFRGGIYCEGSDGILQNLIVTENMYEGIKLKDSNPVIRNSVISDNGGSGIYAENSNPVFTNLIISNNTGTEGNGGGMYLKNSNPRLINGLIEGNHASKGGGVYCFASNPVLVNSTVVSNTASFAGGIYCGAGSFAKIVNSIFWENLPHQIMLQGVYTQNSVEVSYSDIMGGQEGIWISGNGTVNWLDGNIADDPMFEGYGEHPYAISDGSPCIDSGNPDTTGLNLPNTDLILNKRFWDGDGNGIEVVDMGAYEYGAIPVATEKNPVQNTKFQVSCYPNPFSGEITFEYELKANELVLLSIYNQVGKEVGANINKLQSKGSHQLQWNAEELPAGVYNYRLSIGNNVKTGKIILVK